MRPTLLPPRPMVIACAIWFLHAMAPAVYLSCIAFAENDSNAKELGLCCMMPVTMNTILGIYLIFIGWNGVRSVFILLSLFVSVTELLIASILILKKYTEPEGYYVLIVGLIMFISMVISNGCDDEYLAWAQSRRVADDPDE